VAALLHGVDAFLTRGMLLVEAGESGCSRSRDGTRIRVENAKSVLHSSHDTRAATLGSLIRQGSA
jgi:hypothetical protein